MKLYIEDGEAIPAVQVLKDADPAPAGYTESDDVTQWDKCVPRCLGSFWGMRDYKALRSEIKSRVYSKAGFVAADFDPGVKTQAKWDLLSAAEQEISARYFIVTPPYRDDVYSTAQQIDLGISHHTSSVMTRSARSVRALSEIYNRLDFADALELDEEINQVPIGTTITKDANDDTTAKVKVKALIRSYIDHGSEGSLEDGGKLGLFDYMLSRVGTPFDGNGMSTKGFTVIGMADMAELATKCHDILSKGEY